VTGTSRAGQNRRRPRRQPDPAACDKPGGGCIGAARRRVRPKLDPFIAVIDQIMKEDGEQPRKQRHTMKGKFEVLRDEHGFVVFKSVSLNLADTPHGHSLRRHLVPPPDKPKKRT